MRSPESERTRPRATKIFAGLIAFGFCNVGIINDRVLMHKKQLVEIQKSQKPSRVENVVQATEQEQPIFIRSQPQRIAMPTTTH